MHAAQWQRPNIRWTTYDKLRRAGLPSDQRIIEPVERHQTIYDRATLALESALAYRSLVRQVLPIDIQDRYWQHGFTTDGGSERYLYPCAGPDDAGPIDPAVIARILDDSQLAMSLREGTSVARLTGNALVFDHGAAAQAVIDTIELSISDVD